MAKDGKKKKVKSRSSTKYATSSDEDNSSDDDDNLLTLFANLNMQQKEKLNELISAIHEKDELLDRQEDFLIKENKKHVKTKNAYAQEVEKNEKLTSELSTCHDTISSLRNENAKLIAKVEKSNVCDDSIVNLRNDNASLIAKIIELNDYKPSTSTVEHVSVCTRCRDINIDAIHDHLAMIKQQNDHIAKLDAKIAEHELENEKFKFACSMPYSGRRPGIKDGIGFQQGDSVKVNALLKDCLILLRAKLPCLKITRATFYTLLVILRTRLGEFMLRRLILFLTMILFIRMRLLALGVLPMLKCLRRNLLLHQMIITFHLRLLMLHMCLLTNQAK
jgi:hypothetical protein